MVYDESCFFNELEAAATIKVSPGFYRLSIFTRVSDSEFPGSDKMKPPDLAIYMTKSELLQYRFRPIAPTIPICPPEQDLPKLKRKIHGVPEPTTSKLATETSPGRFKGRVMYSDAFGMLAVTMKASERKRFGFQTGKLIEISFGSRKEKQQIHAIIAPEKGFDPVSWPNINRLKRKYPNLAQTLVVNDSVFFSLIKESRKQPLHLQPGFESNATMKLLESEVVETKPSAKSSDKTVMVCEKFPADLTELDELIHLLDVAQHWTLAFLFERRRISYIGAINA